MATGKQKVKSAARKITKGQIKFLKKLRGSPRVVVPAIIGGVIAGEINQYYKRKTKKITSSGINKSTKGVRVKSKLHKKKLKTLRAKRK